MELLGLIDALEATILSSPKLLLTNKTIIDEPKLISIIDKIRLVIKNGGHIIQDYTVTNFPKDEPRPEPVLERKIITDYDLTSSGKATGLDQVDEILERAKQEAQEIIANADSYALDILEKLHLSIMKVQRNVVRIEQTIEESKSNLKEDPMKDKFNKI